MRGRGDPAQTVYVLERGGTDAWEISTGAGCSCLERNSDVDEPEACGRGQPMCFLIVQISEEINALRPVENQPVLKLAEQLFIKPRRFEAGNRKAEEFRIP